MVAEQHEPLWRVVAHDGLGWWSVRSEPYTDMRLAEEEAARLVHGKHASNAGVYLDAGGRAQVPRWMHVKDQEPEVGS